MAALIKDWKQIILEAENPNGLKMTDHQKFKALQKEFNLNYHDIAKITGHTYGSVKDALQPNKPFPRWLRLALYVWEKK